MNEQQDFLWRIYERINSWISIADTKASVLLTFYGILISIIITYKDFMIEIVNSKICIISFIFLPLFSLCLVLAIFLRHLS